ELDPGKFRDDLPLPGNHVGRTECERLRNHVAEVALNDKELLGNTLQIPKHRLETRNGNSLAQVGINQQHAVREGVLGGGPQQMGLNGVFRLQYRADSRYLVGLVGNEMDQHVMPTKKANPYVRASKARHSKQRKRAP